MIWPVPAALQQFVAVPTVSTSIKATPLYQLLQTLDLPHRDGSISLATKTLSMRVHLEFELIPPQIALRFARQLVKTLATSTQAWNGQMSASATTRFERVEPEVSMIVIWLARVNQQSIVEAASV